MTNLFYKAFEDRFRGSFELIKSRLEVYLPFTKPFTEWDEKPRALDLGCGRGEWMVLLQEQGFQVQGVDVDEGMLELCRARKFDVVQCDALEYIKSLASESLNVITAFHFVEHISFSVLQQIIDEAHRILKPGGLLIMETPNSENLLVGTSSFYIDPTHKRPLPASLLSYLVEYAKFGRIKTLFLQEPPRPDVRQRIGLHTVLEGVSPDYAVVSQKNAEPSICTLFDAPFQQEYGIRLLPLVKRYDQQVEGHVQTWQKKFEHAEQQIEQLTQRTHYLETTLQSHLNRFNQELSRIYAGRYGRIIKWLHKKIAQVKSGLMRKLSHLRAVLIKKTKGWIKQKWFLLRRLKAYVLNKLNHYPRFKRVIYKLLMYTGITSGLRRIKFRLKMQLKPGIDSIPIFAESPQCLSLRATHIYHTLQAAIEKKGSSECAS